jgi:hypothetical protein
MKLSEQAERELQSIADQINTVAQRIRAFRERHGNLDFIIGTTEYRTLHIMFDNLKKEIDRIP